MLYDARDVFHPQYEWASSNQYGNRYRKIGNKKTRVLKMSASVNDAKDLQRLILLSDSLLIPVRYDFDSRPQRAYIEITTK